MCDLQWAPLLRNLLACHHWFNHLAPAIMCNLPLRSRARWLSADCYNDNKWLLVDIIVTVDSGWVFCVCECMRSCPRVMYLSRCLQGCCMHACYASLIYITCNEIIASISMAAPRLAERVPHKLLFPWPWNVHSSPPPTPSYPLMCKVPVLLTLTLEEDVRCWYERNLRVLTSLLHRFLKCATTTVIISVALYRFHMYIL